MSDSTKPIIVGFVANLLDSTRIQSVATAVGFQMRWVERESDFGEVDWTAPEETPGEMLYGREGQLFQQIIHWQPALLLFDLANEAIPWIDWLPALKSSPATRRLPVIAYGPHEDVALFQTAKSRGADAVYARSRFFSDMKVLFEKHAQLPDHDLLAATCAEPLADLALEGIHLFNQGQYYQCHDALEEAWNQDQTPGRELYRGILQYGIALYQIERGNYRGAVKMLLRLRQWLDPLPETCRGINISKLRENILTVSDIVQDLGPEQIDAFDPTLVAPIEIVEVT